MKGGQDADALTWRWMALMPRIGCGGTIISDQVILTAAHCCDGDDPLGTRFQKKDVVFSSLEKCRSASLSRIFCRKFVTIFVALDFKKLHSEIEFTNNLKNVLQRSTK